jgi:hypothetical protein
MQRMLEEAVVRLLTVENCGEVLARSSGGGRVAKVVRVEMAAGGLRCVGLTALF